MKSTPAETRRKTQDMERNRLYSKTCYVNSFQCVSVQFQAAHVNQIRFAFIGQ